MHHNLFDDPPGCRPFRWLHCSATMTNAITNIFAAKYLCMFMLFEVKEYACNF